METDDDELTADYSRCSPLLSSVSLIGCPGEGDIDWSVDISRAANATSIYFFVNILTLLGDYDDDMSIRNLDN